MAVPYLEASGWEVTPDSVRDEEGFVFPVPGKDEPCLVDYEGYKSKGLRPEFFDYEFIYRAGGFRDLSGGSFKVFRKNCRRIERVNPVYRPVDPEEALRFFLSWLEDKETFEALDATVRYLSRAAPWGLFIEERLVGFNAWDQNWRFVNFRYSFAEPGVGEYLRLCFYLALEPETLVNDGGSLGNPGLERFKRKMNPVEVRERYGWN